MALSGMVNREVGSRKTTKSYANTFMCTRRGPDLADDLSEPRVGAQLP
jgi:hypothetical protein